MRTVGASLPVRERGPTDQLLPWESLRKQTIGDDGKNASPCVLIVVILSATQARKVEGQRARHATEHYCDLYLSSSIDNPSCAISISSTAMSLLPASKLGPSYL